MFYCVLDLFIPLQESCFTVVAPLFHRLPILSANPFAVEATKFTPSFTLWLAVLCHRQLLFQLFQLFQLPLLRLRLVFSCFYNRLPKARSDILYSFSARLATFPTGTKFRSVHPAAMSLSFDDNSFPVIGSLPVTARIASFTPMNSAAPSIPFSHHDFSCFFSFYGLLSIFHFVSFDILHQLDETFERYAVILFCNL